jgi:predicted ATPase
VRDSRASGPLVHELVLLRDQVPDWSEYPFSLPAVRDLSTLRLDPSVTFFVGENGSGKSTIVEAVAVAAGMNAEGGGGNFQFSTRASHSQLGSCMRLSRSTRRIRTNYFLRAESYFNVATEIEELDKAPGLGARIISSYGGRSLHEQSHGESFLALAMNRFGPDGFYVLDEPEAALSLTGQLALLRRIRELVDDGSQFVLATHSPILLAYPDALIYEVGERGVRAITYHETQQYQLTRDFLADPDQFLHRLFDN